MSEQETRTTVAAGGIRERAWLALVLLLTLLVYLPSLGNGFAHDDVFAAKAQIGVERRNPMVSELQPPEEYFRSPYWRGSGQETGLYRPLTVLSFAIVYRWFGRHLGEAEAFPQRLLNLLLHVVATWLVFHLVRPFVRSGWPAVAGAAVFGLHAVHSEPVLAIVGRADLLAFVLGAASVLLCERAVLHRGVRRIGFATLAGTLAFLAFCSKESAVAWVPFSAFYGLALALARTGGKASGGDMAAGAVLRLAIHSLPLLLFLLLRHPVVASVSEAARLPLPEANPLVALPLLARVLTATLILTFGLLKTLLPSGLCCYYGHAVFEIIESPLDPRFLFCATLLIGSLIASLVLARSHPLLLLAGAAFFGFGFLTSNLPFFIGVDFGERLLYQPSLGLSFLIAGLLEAGGARLRGLGALVLVAWLAWSMALILQRNPVWKDSDTLYLNDVEANPMSYFLVAAAGKALGARGDLHASERLFERATAISAEHGLAWANLGITRMRLGKMADAGEHLRRALGLLTEDRKRALVHYNLATLAAHQDDAAAIREHLERAVRLAPGVPMYRMDLLVTLRERIPSGEARALLETGVSLVPESPRWLVGRALLELDRGSVESAEAIAREAMARMPDEAAAALALAEVLIRRGRAGEGRELAGRLVADPSVSPLIRWRARGMLRSLGR